MADEHETDAPAPAAMKPVDYTVHPFAELNPPTPADEQAAMLLSVKKQGVQEDIVLWKSSRSVFLLDGRTRLKAYNDLVTAGVTMTEAGEPLTLPTFYMPDGTTAREALEFVISKGTRRNLNQGQKALAGIKTFMALQAQAKKDGAEFEPDGDRAEFVARMSGSNRLYCVRGFQLLEDVKASGLFDAAFTGLYSVNAAFAILERRRKGLSDTPTAADLDNDGKGNDDSAAPVTDNNGTAVEGKRMVDVFKSRELFTEAASYLNKARTVIQEAGNSAGGRYLEVDPLNTSLNDIIRIVRGSQPYHVCPACSGDNDARKTCDACAKQGWLSARSVAVAKKAEKAAGGGDDAAPKKKKKKKNRGGAGGERTRKADAAGDGAAAPAKKKKAEVEWSGEGGAQEGASERQKDD